MNRAGFQGRSEWELSQCPYCNEKLGARQVLERKTKKKFTCPRCGKVVDERNVRW
jgi:transposase